MKYRRDWQSNMYMDPEFYGNDLELGPIMAPSRSSRSSLHLENGKPIYDVHYGSDEWSRRITPGQETGTRAHPLIFLGCCYTFGMGVEDNETVPAAAARLVQDYRVYNYGCLAWGTGHILRRVSRPIAQREMPEKGGVGIYIFTDYQMRMTFGALSLIRTVPSWRSILPYYYLDSQGVLHGKGRVAESRPFETWLYGVLAKSAILNYFHIEIPLFYRQQHFKLVAEMIADIRKRLIEGGKINKFYVVAYPGVSWLAKPLIRELDTLGIPSLDYSEINLWQYTDTPVIPNEVHPTGAAHQFVAEQIVRDLGLQ